MASSDQYRMKVESKHLCDLGNHVDEKYDHVTSWKMSLRSSFDEKQSKYLSKILKRTTQKPDEFQEIIVEDEQDVYQNK